MAIQQRRGLYKDFDKSKMLPAEYAVTLGKDATADDTNYERVYATFSNGSVKRMMTVEDAANQLTEATETATKQADADATLAKSYAVGGTSSRTGEDTDNAKYYKEQAATSATSASTNAVTATEKASEATTSATDASNSATSAAQSAANAEATAASLNHAYYYAGSCATADLPTTGQKVGMTYNLTDAGTYGPAGTNVAWNGTEWDPLAGIVDLSGYQTIANKETTVTDDDTKYPTGGAIVDYALAKTGTATSATALTTSAGSTTQPVYFSSGKPVATSYSVAKSVPSDAVFTDTHYASGSVVNNSATAVSNTTTALTNGNVYLNHVENGAVKNSHKISGSGATTVASDASGNIVISSTDTNTTYGVATTSANGLMSSTDKSKLDGVASRANYRGKNLGSTVTAEQYAAIQVGTFEDMYIGDYWTIGGVNYRIAAFDYYLRAGDTDMTTHHVTLVPDGTMYNYVMNDSNVTTGGYVGSKMYTSGLANAKTTINNAFGSAHILTHRQYLCNAVNNGKPSGGSWYDSTVELMTEQNVYGGKVFGAGNDGSTVPALYTVDKSQYPLFAFRPDLIPNRTTFWLRDVASAAAFAYVNFAGAADYYGASGALGVRPAFSIKS